jgi:hypothetical protein
MPFSIRRYIWWLRKGRAAPTEPPTLFSRGENRYRVRLRSARSLRRHAASAFRRLSLGFS